MQHRNYCFTLNNPTQEEETWFSQENFSIPIKTMLWMKEKGTNQTEHLQGYLELTRAMSLPLVKKKLIHFQRAHLEARKGTRCQASLYCLKTLLKTTTENTGACEPSTSSSNSSTSPNDTELQQLQTIISDDSWEIPPEVHYFNGEGISLKNFATKQVKTKTKTNTEEKMEIIKQMIDEGKSDLEIAEFNFNLFCTKFTGISRYRLLKTTPRDSAITPNVIVIIGPTGTGKSRWALDHFPNAFWKTKGQWWDTYHQQTAVIIDEFYGWLPYDFTLRLTDRYPMQVEIKGGAVQMVAHTFIFTSNKYPHQWWKDIYFKAFERRVSTWIHMSQHLEKTFIDYETFYEHALKMKQEEQ